CVLFRSPESACPTVRPLLETTIQKFLEGLFFFCMERWIHCGGHFFCRTYDVDPASSGRRWAGTRSDHLLGMGRISLYGHRYPRDEPDNASAYGGRLVDPRLGATHCGLAAVHHQ